MTRAVNLAEAAGSGFMRNKIINGGMRVWQRGTSFSVGTSPVFTADRWLCAATGGPINIYRGGAGTGYNLTVEGAATCTHAWVAQRIESINVNYCVGRKITVSLRLYHSGPGFPINIEILRANALDNWIGETVIETSPTYNVASNDYTELVFTLSNPLPVDADKGLCVRIGLPSGLKAGSSFALLNIQLEAGSVATPFEHRPYGLEEMLCQRYYQIVNGNLRQYSYSAGVACSSPVPFSRPMRVPPTAVLSGGTGINTGADMIESVTANGARYTVNSNVTNNMFEYTGRVISLSAEL